MSTGYNAKHTIHHLSSGSSGSSGSSTSSGNCKKLKFDGLLVSKNTFSHLKYYTQRIYLTLISTTCVKIHRIPYVILETISHFSQHNPSALF